MLSDPGAAAVLAKDAAEADPLVLAIVLLALIAYAAVLSVLALRRGGGGRDCVGGQRQQRITPGGRE